jgi:hypothetical protein
MIGNTLPIKVKPILFPKKLTNLDDLFSSNIKSSGNDDKNKVIKKDKVLMQEVK